MLRQSLAPRRQSTNLRKISNEEPVKVVIRIRPLPSSSSNESPARAFRAGSNSVIEDSKKEYNYDNVFGEEADTTQIYSEFVKDIVSSVSNDGLNGTIFTYGQTSSGKTFTMQGIHETEGLIQYAVRDIFKTIKQQMNANSESAVKVSYVEVYNEELRDLLGDNRKPNPSSLEIQEDDRKGTIMVKNLEVVAVQSAEQLMQVFRAGEVNRSMGSTTMNDRSSRSHTILQITIEKKTTFNDLAEDYRDEKENNELASPQNNSFMLKTRTRTSTLNLVDLAGSESVRVIGTTRQRQKEGKMINKSLFTLSTVLRGRGQKNPAHINYRDSKLTRILKPSLSGNARMAVVCCISPSESYIDETRSTLNFAKDTSLVKMNAVSNEVITNASMNKVIEGDAGIDAKSEAKSLSTQLEATKAELVKVTKTNADLTSTNETLQSQLSDAVSQGEANDVNMKKLETKIEGLEQSLATAREMLESLVREKDSTAQILTQMKSKINELEGQIKSLTKVRDEIAETNGNATLEELVNETRSSSNESAEIGSDEEMYVSNGSLENDNGSDHEPIPTPAKKKQQSTEKPVDSSLQGLFTANSSPAMDLYDAKSDHKDHGGGSREGSSRLRSYELRHRDSRRNKTRSRSHSRTRDLGRKNKNEEVEAESSTEVSNGSSEIDEGSDHNHSPILSKRKRQSTMKSRVVSRPNSSLVMDFYNAESIVERPRRKRSDTRQNSSSLYDDQAGHNDFYDAKSDHNFKLSNIRSNHDESQSDPAIEEDITQLKNFPRDECQSDSKYRLLCKISGCSMTRSEGKNNDMCKRHYRIFKAAGRESAKIQYYKYSTKALKEFNKELIVVCKYCNKTMKRPLTMCYRENGRRYSIACSCEEKSHKNWTVQGQASNKGWRKENGEWKMYTRRKCKLVRGQK
eukprot:scaffold55148_cov49-Cyclotella_meneghiniana.AAC.10